MLFFYLSVLRFITYFPIIRLYIMYVYTCNIVEQKQTTLVGPYVYLYVYACMYVMYVYACICM